MKKVLFILACLSVLYCFDSCRSSSRVSSAEFGRYITGFTSGRVAPDQEIRIELSSDVLDSIPTDKRDSAFLQDHIDIFPKTAGSFYWSSYRTIGFRPATHFKEGAQYHVQFHLGKFIHTESKFNTFEFNFETEARKMDVTTNGLELNNAFAPEWEHYQLTATSNFDADPRMVARCFTATEEGRALPVTCVQTEPKHYKITIDSIERKAKAQEIRMGWNLKPLGLKEKKEEVINVPGLGDFRVINMSVKDDDGDQQVNITFSDAIQPDQKLDGLIEVEDARELSFNITGNVVTAFLGERIEGTKKITVNKGILNYGKYRMDSTTSGLLTFAGVKPALRMNNKGCILPNSQGLLYPFESIGLHTVDVRVIKIKEDNIHQFLQVNELDGEDGLTRVGKIIAEKTVTIIADTMHPQNQWTTHILDLGKLINPEPGALYRVCIRFRKAYTYLACRHENNNETSPEDYLYRTDPSEDSTWNEYNWHGNGFDGYNTWRWSSDDDPCSDSYYEGGAISSNILASDIGVIYQEEKDHTARIVSTNLLHASALPQTEISLYSFTKEKIADGVTDDNGFLVLTPNQKPFLLVARKGNQRAYLKLTNSNALSLSRFDIEGTDQGSGLKGFLYAERGVWRPGDSVFLHFILNDQANPLPAQHPIKFELTDPDGQTVFTRIVTENTGHIYPLYFRTSPQSRMGTYRATVSVGNATFSQSILLEYIVPNRMKLVSNVEGRLLTQADSSIHLQVNWLNGAIGKGLKTQASVSMRPNWNFFSKHRDYEFIAPYNKDYRGSFELPESTTSTAGAATFRQPAVEMNDAPGVMTASYVFKAFEQGGGYSIDKSVSNYSIFDSYVGIRQPQGGSYYGSLDYNKSYAFPYVVVNKDQAIVPGHHLHLKIYEMQRSNWYEADATDIASFKTYSGKICVKDTQWVAAKGEGSFSFGNIGKAYGRYMMILKDLASGHETGLIVTFDNPSWDRYSSEDVDHETMVQLSASKKTYTVGETIRLSVPAPESAHILVSIESGNKILRQFWATGNRRNEPIDIATTKDMAPGIYIHATVLQPHHYTKDGSPIRQYGIMPIAVEDPETRLSPVIKMNDEIRPETQASIQVSEQNGKEMNYSLVLVDEGLLDLTHYRLPAIWKYMNSQQSLKIKTWDLYDLVIGAYAGKIQNVFSIGGDGAYDESEDSKANRFRPAIINFGITHLGAGERKTHTFTIPNYSGRMKAFVVAYAGSHSGSAEKEFYVKKPLMLLTAAPRMMSAGETYTIPVTLFNMEAKARKVKVSCRLEGLPGMPVLPDQSVTFNGQGDAVVNFGIKLPEATGILHMTVNASDGKETAREQIEFQVKPTRPAVNHARTFEVLPGASVNLDLAAKGVKGTYRGSLEISDKVHFDFEDKLNYLIQYPHGCVEQTTSSAFAQLFLNDLQDVSDEDAKSIREHVETVIRRLPQYQTYNGGFAYWPYQYDVNEYASVYVLHFLAEAKDKGFQVSEYCWKNTLNYQKEAAKHYENSFTSNSYSYYDKELTQAYRLYLLARLNMADLTAMNKLLNGDIRSNTSKALLAKAYSLTGKSGVAQTLIAAIKPGTAPAMNYSGTFGSSLRDESLQLLALANLAGKPTCQSLADNINAQLSNGWSSTLATSLALTSLSRYYALDAPAAKQYAFGGKSHRFSKHRETLRTGAVSGPVTFTNSGLQKLYLTLNERYSDNSTNLPLINNGMNLKVTYLDMNNRPMNEAALAHGSNFVAKVSVGNPGSLLLEHVALELPIANGWQVLSNRYMDDQAIYQDAGYDYKDAKDDGVYYYFNLKPGETKTYYVTLNASYKGTFYLPMAQCYPMYNERYKAQQAGKWVQVTD